MLNLTKKSPSSTDALRFAIISSCPEAWGGSEELWAGTALFLVAAGHEVEVFKTNINSQHPRILQLRAAGCQVTELEQVPSLGFRLLNRLRPYHQQYSRRSLAQQVLRVALVKFRPQLSLVSQGSNYDGIPFAEVCREMNLPFALLSHKAVDFFFPPWHERTAIQQVYRAAQQHYFVARHSWQLTQCQLGMALPNAEIVRNPVNVPLASESPMPAFGPERAVRLVYVGRLEVLDKGLDILLQVLVLPKWRLRPLQLTCFGEGGDRLALQEMTNFLQLNDKITFAGQVADVTTIWQMHHALVMPSRNEGLPLALVEAMLCGRPAIVTPAGGIAEIFLDNITGFLADAATVPALDAALERAWSSLDDWPTLGAQAASHARAFVPPDATARFGKQLIKLVRP